MSFTRRHWLREVRDAVRWPLSMMESKHARIGDGEKADRRLSQFRVVLFMFALAFVAHWPAEWTSASVSALAIIVFGLPVEALFVRVPVAEALGALQAFFGGVVGRAQEGMTSVIHRAPGPSTVTVTDAPGPDQGEGD